MNVFDPTLDSDEDSESTGLGSRQDTNNNFLNQQPNSESNSRASLLSGIGNDNNNTNVNNNDNNNDDDENTNNVLHSHHQVRPRQESSTSNVSSVSASTASKRPTSVNSPELQNLSHVAMTIDQQQKLNQKHKITRKLEDLRQSSAKTGSLILSSTSTMISDKEKNDNNNNSLNFLQIPQAHYLHSQLISSAATSEDNSASASQPEPFTEFLNGNIHSLKSSSRRAMFLTGTFRGECACDTTPCKRGEICKSLSRFGWSFPLLRVFKHQNEPSNNSTAGTHVDPAKIVGSAQKSNQNFSHFHPVPATLLPFVGTSPAPQMFLNCPRFDHRSSMSVSKINSTTTCITFAIVGGSIITPSLTTKTISPSAVILVEVEIPRKNENEKQNNLEPVPEWESSVRVVQGEGFFPIHENESSLFTHLACTLLKADVDDEESSSADTLLCLGVLNSKDGDRNEISNLFLPAHFKMLDFKTTKLWRNIRTDSSVPFSLFVIPPSLDNNNISVCFDGEDENKNRDPQQKTALLLAARCCPSISFDEVGRISETKISVKTENRNKFEDQDSKKLNREKPSPMMMMVARASTSFGGESNDLRETPKKIASSNTWSQSTSATTTPVKTSSFGTNDDNTNNNNNNNNNVITLPRYPSSNPPLQLNPLQEEVMIRAQKELNKRSTQKATSSRRLMIIHHQNFCASFSFSCGGTNEWVASEQSSDNQSNKTPSSNVQNNNNNNNTIMSLSPSSAVMMMDARGPTAEYNEPSSSQSSPDDIPSNEKRKRQDETVGDHECESSAELSLTKSQRSATMQMNNSFPVPPNGKSCSNNSINNGFGPSDNDVLSVISPTKNDQLLSTSTPKHLDYFLKLENPHINFFSVQQELSPPSSSSLQNYVRNSNPRNSSTSRPQSSLLKKMPSSVHFGMNRGNSSEINNNSTNPQTIKTSLGSHHQHFDVNSSSSMLNQQISSCSTDGTSSSLVTPQLPQTHNQEISSYVDNDDVPSPVSNLRNCKDETAKFLDSIIATSSSCVMNQNNNHNNGRNFDVVSLLGTQTSVKKLSVPAERIIRNNNEDNNQDQNVDEETKPVQKATIEVPVQRFLLLAKLHAPPLPALVISGTETRNQHRKISFTNNGGINRRHHNNSNGNTNQSDDDENETSQGMLFASNEESNSQSVSFGGLHDHDENRLNINQEKRPLSGLTPSPTPYARATVNSAPSLILHHHLPHVDHIMKGIHSMKADDEDFLPLLASDLDSPQHHLLHQDDTYILIRVQFISAESYRLFDAVNEILNGEKKQIVNCDKQQQPSILKRSNNQNSNDNDDQEREIAVRRALELRQGSKNSFNGELEKQIQDLRSEFTDFKSNMQDQLGEIRKMLEILISVSPARDRLPLTKTNDMNQPK